MKWYEKDSLAVGFSSDVVACAQIFTDVSVAAARAKLLLEEFTTCGAEIWSGQAADKLRAQVEDAPDGLRRFDTANHNVATALNLFAPSVDNYMSAWRPYVDQGSQAAVDIETFKRLKDLAVSNLRSQQSAINQVLSTFDDFSSDPEVAYYNSQITNLKGSLRTLELAFNGVQADFLSAVDVAFDAISRADDVLYDSRWDEIFNQTVKPAIEIVRIILTIASIIVTILGLIIGGPVLALVALILAAALLVTSLVTIIGSAAAGEKVTKEMWVNLALDAVGVVFAGAKLANAKNAVKISQNVGEARNFLAGGNWGKFQETVVKIGGDRTKLEGAERLVEIGERVVDGGDDAYHAITDSDHRGVHVTKLLLDVVGGATSGSVGGKVIDVGHDAIGLVPPVGDVIHDHASPVKLSPKNWPGLSGVQG